MFAGLPFATARRGTSALLFCTIALIGRGTIASQGDLVRARDHQDLAALDQLIAHYKANLQTHPSWADAQYQLALAYSYAAEVAMEVHDKKRSEAYAEAGIDPARSAASWQAGHAEFHRLLGELCAQTIPANPFFGAMKYGQCARDEINKAIELDRKLALAYVSRGVGNYYLPQQMGGGTEVALRDIDQAITIDPNLGEAYLWKGVTLRKAGRNAEARQALEKAIQLDPERVWIKEQLAKTPPQ
jgi:tetratricopeptide (TPR) repeat protein